MAQSLSTFKRNLLFGFGISLFLLTISSIASYLSIRNLLSSANWVSHTNEVMNEIDKVLMATKEGESDQRGFLLTGDQKFLTPYNDASEEAKVAVNKLMELIVDNEAQQQDGVRLKQLANQRFAQMQEVIDKKNKTGIIPNDLYKGKRIMDEMTTLVDNMKNREQRYLVTRTADLNRFATLTPLLIVVAALLGLFVTVFSFYRVLADYETRSRMQLELEKKDQEITQRLGIIRSIAEKISSGNYDTRLDGEGQDLLGSISGSLNKMGESLRFSFNRLSQKEWQQSGIAGLNDKLLGQKELDQLAGNVLEFVSSYTGAEVGVFHYAAADNILTYGASVGLRGETIKKEWSFGEGLAGKAAQSGKLQEIRNISDSSLILNTSIAGIQPAEIIAVPVFYERRLKAVLELASVQGFSEQSREFLNAASYNIGMAIHAVRDHQRLQELLMETQAQSEELLAQHSELENINSELQAQSEKLQSSEEELRVQQEELQQSNLELEERSRLLEEKNELIMERNMEIQVKAEELALSSRYKSEFLANMSHELRTPLNSILLLSRLLSENHENNLSTDQIEYAKVIQFSGNGLLTLIDEILDLSKIESGKMDLEYHDVSTTDLLEDLRGLFAPMASEKNIGFQINMTADVPAILETDRLRVEQILRNLISNAMKFTSQGSISVEVTGLGAAVLFRIVDTGIGIPKDKLENIFEAFQQADGSTRRKYGGTGLGLSISRKLARLMGGEIAVTSEEGKGSSFSLAVPVKKPVASNSPSSLPLVKGPEPEILREEPAASTEPEYIAPFIPEPVSDDRNSIGSNDRVILIIEDDTAFAKALLDFARKNKYKGIVAVRGDEGITLAKKYMPVGILLDLQLPVKSGWEVMEALKSDPQTRVIPVHMMSSHQARTKSISKGAIDFINKPVAFEKMNEIFSKIEHALSREPRKVLIVEENHKHAEALAYFLETFNVSSEIRSSVTDGITALSREDVDCVILDMVVPSSHSYDILEGIKQSPGMENLPIIIFTGKNLSHMEEMRIRKYADSIVLKTAHSYQRILDEVSLFLHLVEHNDQQDTKPKFRKLGELSDVLKGKTVLVADDDVRNIFSLSKSLEKYGMKVVSAINGKEALKQLESRSDVDVVLMDMMMPELDGYESIRRIRGMSAFKNLPVIAVTAKAMTGDREKCMEAGASDYITKPVDIDQLISLLRVWLYATKGR